MAARWPTITAWRRTSSRARYICIATHDPIQTDTLPAGAAWCTRWRNVIWSVPVEQPRDRIVKMITVRAGDLKADERNWRLHPDNQREAVEASWHRIGNIDVLRVRRDEAGDLVLVDGHLRASMDPDTKLKCILLDLDEAEAGEALATFDPIGAMAEADAEALRGLIAKGDEGLSDLTPQGFADWLRRTIEDEIHRGGAGWLIAGNVADQAQRILESVPLVRPQPPAAGRVP